MLEKSLGETRCTREVLAKDSFGGGTEPAPVCVCVCLSVPAAGAVFAALLARHWLRHCSCCDIGALKSVFGFVGLFTFACCKQ